MGDFYETFDEDAEKTAKALDIVLTSRPVAKGVRVPMAGIPYHAVDNYIGRLIDKGYHVAICEQVGEQPEKGLFERDVVRVITPGTLVEPNLLQSEKNNYLACIVTYENHAGLAYVDISTGEFATTQIQNDDILVTLRAELERLAVAELLVAEDWQVPPGFPDNITTIPQWYFEPGRAKEAIKARFNVSSLDGLGIRDLPWAMRASARLLNICKTRKKAWTPRNSVSAPIA